MMVLGGQEMEYSMQAPDANAAPVILMEDDPTCPCHEDQLLISSVLHFVDDGLLTHNEATSFVAGKLL